jgi:N-methylhydantoinase B
MSNVMIGGARSDGTTWAFYETNGCGMGARPNADGIDGIQCHMTNTLNTPIEAIEREYPMRVDRYEFADGTGGRGRYRGGDGLIRALTLTDGSARVSLLAERHAVAPRGARGAGDGATGMHTLLTNGANALRLPAKTTRAFAVGQTLAIQTPGGGAYGEGDGEGAG